MLVLLAACDDANAPRDTAGGEAALAGAGAVAEDEASPRPETPIVEGKAEAEPEPGSETPKPEGEAEDGAKQDPEPDGKTELKTDGETEPKPDTVVEPKPDKPKPEKPKPDKTKPDAVAEPKPDKPKPDTVEPEPDTTPTPSGADGRTIYSKKCKSCHGATGAADTSVGEKEDIGSWKEPGWKGKWPLAKVKAIIEDGKPGTKMKAFKGKLTPEEIDAVSEYARSLGS